LPGFCKQGSIKNKEELIMVWVDCKKCGGTGKYHYQTKTGMRTRICNECSNGKIDIIYIPVKVTKNE
jgi:hypothetical protein